MTTQKKRDNVEKYGELVAAITNLVYDSQAVGRALSQLLEDYPDEGCYYRRDKVMENWRRSTREYTRLLEDLERNWDKYDAWLKEREDLGGN